MKLGAVEFQDLRSDTCVVIIWARSSFKGNLWEMGDLEIL